MKEKNQLVYGSHADFKNASLTKQLGFLVFHDQNTLVHDSMRVYHTFCEQDVALYHRDASVGMYGVTDIILFQLIKAQVLLILWSVVMNTYIFFSPEGDMTYRWHLIAQTSGCIPILP